MFNDTRQAIEWLMRRGVSVSFYAVTEDMIKLAIRWPGHNGRNKQEFMFEGFDTLKLLEQAASRVDELLPVKISEPILKLENEQNENAKS